VASSRSPRSARISPFITDVVGKVEERKADARCCSSGGFGSPRKLSKFNKVDTALKMVTSLSGAASRGWWWLPSAKTGTGGHATVIEAIMRASHHQINQRVACEDSARRQEFEGMTALH